MYRSESSCSLRSLQTPKQTSPLPCVATSYSGEFTKDVGNRKMLCLSGGGGGLRGEGFTEQLLPLRKEVCLMNKGSERV